MSNSVPQKQGSAVPQSEKILEEWTFPEYEQHERSRRWFIVAGIVSGAMVVWAVFTGNFLFAFFIIMVAVIVMTHHYNAPSEVQFQITRNGLYLGDHFYAFDAIAKFWIIYEPPEVKKLYFQFKDWFHPKLSIPLADKNPLKIRALLLEYLEEDLSQEREPASDVFARRWKL